MFYINKIIKRINLIITKKNFAFYIFLFYKFLFQESLIKLYGYSFGITKISLLFFNDILY